MRGHVYKRQRGTKNGKPSILWYLVLDVGTDPTTGQRKQKTHGGYKTKREAEEAQAKLVTRLDEGTYISPSRMTFSSFVDDHWYASVQPRLKPSTFDGYQRDLRNYVIPALGRKRLQHITAADLNRLYGELLLHGRKKTKKDCPGLSEKTVHNVHLVISKVLKDALDAGLISQSVAQRAKPPRPGSTGYDEIKAWSSNQLSSFLSSQKDHHLYEAWYLASFTGMRRSELLGLRWKDLDLKQKRLSIRHTRVSVAYKVTSTTPKNRQARVIDLDTDTVEILRSYRRRRAKSALADGRSLDENGLVFTYDDGTVFHPDTFSQAFDRAVGQTDLPSISLHGLRHTHATIAIAAGVPVKVVSERLGHASPEFTMRVYQHVIPGMQRAAAEQIAQAVRDAEKDDDDLDGAIEADA